MLGDDDRCKPVERWIETKQRVETREQLLCGVTGLQFVGKSLHVHPRPCRIMRTHLAGLASTGTDKEDPYYHIWARASGACSHGLQESVLEPTAKSDLSPMCLKESPWLSLLLVLDSTHLTTPPLLPYFAV